MQLLVGVQTKSLWFSDDLFIASRALSDLMYGYVDEQGGSIAFGKRNYRDIALLREQMEILHARDMLTLYDVDGFLRSKKEAAENFREVEIAPGGGLATRESQG